MIDIPKSNSMQIGNNNTEYFINENNQNSADQQINENHDYIIPESDNIFNDNFDQSNCPRISPPPVFEEEHQRQKPKYNIMDLYWLISPYYRSQDYRFEENEAQLVIISYNMDFGNLRIALCRIPDIAIYNATIFLQKTKRLIAGTVYPVSCFRILHNYNKNIQDKFTCVEQLFDDTGEKWQKERPLTSFEIYNNKIILNILNAVNNSNFFYRFETDFHLSCFLDSLNFVIDKGRLLHGNNIIG